MSQDGFSLPRRTRAAVLGTVLSTALVAGMIGTAIAYSPPDPPTAFLVTDGAAVSSDSPVTTPAAVAGRTPAP
ncbi:hypothetical protein ACVGOW_03390 [Pseudonocardia saturnea]